MRLRTILHSTDLSDAASRALELAVRLAVLHDATLQIFHAVLLHAEGPARTERLLRNYVKAAHEHAKRWTRDGHALTVDASCERSVFAFDAIIDKVGQLQPDLIVMGTHGRSTFRRFLIGSNAEKILRHAPCHVLTVKADARIGCDTGFSRVLVPVDFSDFSRRALVAARAVVSESGGAVTLLHVVEPISTLYYAGNVTSRAQLDPDLPKRVETNLREWAGGGASDVIVAEGPTALQITQTSDEIGADLIAIGTRGLTGLEHLLVGSVTERVCRFANVPVLTVK